MDQLHEYHVSEYESDMIAVNEEVIEQVQPQNILDLADVTFIVENKEVKAIKSCLMLNSPVFKAMFMNEFKEKSCDQISLPGKKYKVFVEFIEVLHSFYPDLGGVRVRELVPLAHEYQVSKLLEKLEDILVHRVMDLKHLVLADKYDLKRLYRQCIKVAASQDIRKLEAESCFNEIERGTLLEIVKMKINQLEKKIMRLKESSKQAETWRRILQNVKNYTKGNVHTTEVCPKSNHVYGANMGVVSTKYGYKGFGTQFEHGCKECHSYVLKNIMKEVEEVEEVEVEEFDVHKPENWH